MDRLGPSVSPFVGRADELRQIAALLTDPTCRLLTLVGPGGIGKTRLALEAAHFLPNRTYFVPLQPLTSPDFLVSAIADALGLQFFPGDEPKQQLLDFLRRKPWVLVLDNFEHLLDGATLLTEILSHVPDTQLLITSRERLNLVEEWVLEVAGLTYPSHRNDSELERFSAVELFVRQARRVKTGFVLTDKNRPAVARICRLVGGMPLAIELAATWVRMLSCEDIAREIEQGLDILTAPTRNIPPRHRSMRAVLDHSWNLLTDSERDVFQRLSVFRSGFRREAAQTVAGASLPLLSALVDKSLLRADADGRYQLHELLHQYGMEQLTQSGRLTATCEAHCTYYTEFLQQRESELQGARQVEALDEIEADFENVCRAWHWALDTRNYALVDKSIESLSLYCEMRSRFYEADELFQQARQKLAPVVGEEPPPVWGRILAHVVTLQGENRTEQRKRYETALAIAQQYNNRVEIGYCLWRLGELAKEHEDYPGAIVLLDQGLDHLTQSHDLFYVAKVLNEIGICYRDWGHLEKAIDFHSRSLDLRREIGDERGAAWCLCDRSRALNGLGRHAEAEAGFQQAGRLWQKLNDRYGYRNSAENRATLALLRGDLDMARSLAREALEIAIDLHAQRDQAYPLAVLGAAANLEENYLEGKQLCEQSLRLPSFPASQSLLRWALAMATCGLGDNTETKRLIEPVLRTSHSGGRLRCLPLAAVLLAREDNFELAAELLALVAASSDTFTRWLDQWPLLARLRVRLEAELGAEAYEAAVKRGGQGALDAAIVTLLPYFRREQDKFPAAPQTLPEPLTQRELEVLQLIGAGLNNREIATRLFVSVGTIKKHNGNIFGKLGATSRTQAIARARELNLI